MISKAVQPLDVLSEFHGPHRLSFRWLSPSAAHGNWSLTDDVATAEGRIFFTDVILQCNFYAQSHGQESLLSAEFIRSRSGWAKEGSTNEDWLVGKLVLTV